MGKLNEFYQDMKFGSWVSRRFETDEVTSFQRACQSRWCPQSCSWWVNCTSPSAPCRWAAPELCRRRRNESNSLERIRWSEPKRQWVFAGASSHSPALVRPPFLNVADVVECAVHRHVVVVAGHVERLAEFNGPLKRKCGCWSLNSSLKITIRSSLC